MFWKKDKKEEKGDTPEVGDFNVVEKKESSRAPQTLPREHGVLKGFYTSEKSSALNSLNQYVFKVFDGVTKNEVKKQVAKSFGVKVKGVKMINLPKKKRSVGHHSGFKKGFKKAIVVLEKGYSIDSAKA